MRRMMHLCLVLCASFVLAACSQPFTKKPNAGIQVITSGVSSSVFLNEQHLNTTPLIERNIQPGEYSLRIEPDDPTYSSYETSVTLRRGLLTVVTWKPAARPELSGGVIYEMEPLSRRDASEVSFVTIPDGAIVSFAGKERTFSPAVIQDVSAGHHEYEITLPSYETQKHTINVIPGHRMIVRAKLAKVEATQGLEQGTETIQAEPSVASAAAALSATQSATASATQNTPAANQATILSTNFYQNGVEVLRVRSTPGQTSETLGYAPVGESYPLLGEQNGWYQISFNRTPGWISSQYAELTN